MTQTNPPAGMGHGAHGVPAITEGHPAFSAAEWEEFRREDRQAGGTVVRLLTAIFIVGLMLYLTIAYICAQ